MPDPRDARNASHRNSQRVDFRGGQVKSKADRDGYKGHRKMARNAISRVCNSQLLDTTDPIKSDSSHDIARRDAIASSMIDAMNQMQSIHIP